MDLTLCDMSDDQSGNAGNGALLSFRLFGFPVSIHASFFVIIGVLGFFPGQNLRDWVIWMLVASVAILVHELGHAVTARLAGMAPSIALVGLGGVTTFSPRAPLSRAVSVGISAAGPGVGLVIGAGIWFLTQDLALLPGSWQGQALSYAFFTTTIWSILNLLPALPLDGGHILEDLLPGDPRVRARRAAMVSIVVALVAAVVGLIAGFTFFGIFAALLILTNALALRDSGDGARARQQAAEPTQAVVDLVVQGRFDDARAALTQLSELDAAEGGPGIDLAVHGMVMAVSGDRDQGMALLVQEVQRRPGDPVPVRALALAHVALEEFDQFGALLAGPYGRSIPPDFVARAQGIAMNREDDETAARLGETFLAEVAGNDPRSAPGPVREWIAGVAVQSARARARSGAADQALAMLDLATRWGYADTAHLETDPAFERLRGDARFQAALRSLRAAQE